MANADKAINQVLIHEGGFVNNPYDRGGATNWGITQATYEAFVGKPVTIDEIRNMPKGNAYLIYKENYWDKVRGDEIDNYGIAYAIFDQAVNRGPDRAIRQAQRVLGVYQTGIMSDSTLNSINQSNPKDFMNDYLAASKQAYLNIVANDPTQAVFKNGWLNRVASIESYVAPYLSITSRALSFLPWVGVAIFGMAAIYVATNEAQRAKA